jgi:hypothetical protein
MSLPYNEQMALAYDIAKALHALNNRTQTKGIPENQQVVERVLNRWFTTDGRRRTEPSLGRQLAQTSFYRRAAE